MPQDLLDKERANLAEQVTQLQVKVAQLEEQWKQLDLSRIQKSPKIAQVAIAAQPTRHFSAFMASEGPFSDDDLWLLDSGATSHIVSDRFAFSNY